MSITATHAGSSHSLWGAATNALSPTKSAPAGFDPSTAKIQTHPHTKHSGAFAQSLDDAMRPAAKTGS